MKGSGTLAWKRCPLPSLPSLLLSTDTHIHTQIRSHPTHTAFKQEAHQKLVISLIHSDSLETQCRLTSVLYTPYIRKMNRPCKHRQRKRERERKRRTKLLQLFSLLPSTKKKDNISKVMSIGWFVLYASYADFKENVVKSNERRSKNTWKSTTFQN